jgi:hypothetical protein
MYAGSLYRCRLALTATLAFSAPSPTLAKSLTVIHSFHSNAYLGGGIIADQNGTLYGVLTSGDGCGEAGCVYALSPPAQEGGAWSYAKIYQFQHKADGYGPQGQLTLGPNGELYGFTGYGSYVIYRLAPPQAGATAWTFTKLGKLADGFAPNPTSPLILSNGALFGLSTGGSQTCPYVGCGGVFEVGPNLNGGWAVTTIAAFDGGSLGGSPAGFAGPDTAGGFYVANQYHGKVIYLLPYNAMWQATVAASFPRSSGLGCLVMGTDGDIYGVAGSFFRARLFQIQPNSGATQWTVNTLAKVSDHQNAPCPDIPGPNGSLIGTVFGDQDAYDGDIFQLSPPATQGASWAYKILTQVGKTGRYGPINAVFGWQGDLYTPVNIAYGPPSAILRYVYSPGSLAAGAK